jgi:hypothetical protein
VSSRTNGLAAAILVAACGGHETAPPASEELSFVTFNADAQALTGYVEEQLVHDALVALDADVLCLQRYAAPEELAAALGHGVVPSLHHEEDEPICDEAALDALLACADGMCTAPDQACLDACMAPFAALGEDCGACVTEGGLSFDAIYERCHARTEHVRYEASATLMTRLPVVEDEVLLLDDPPGGVVHARVTTAGGPLDVICGELVAPAHQDQVRAHTDAMASVLVLGDLGAGPRGDDFAALEESAFAPFVAAGFLDSYAEGCTLCADNELVAVAGYDEGSFLPDHILVRGVGGSLAARRVLDEEVQSDTALLMSHYGAQFGVALTLAREIP